MTPASAGAKRGMAINAEKDLLSTLYMAICPHSIPPTLMSATSVISRQHLDILQKSAETMYTHIYIYIYMMSKDTKNKAAQ